MRRDVWKELAAGLLVGLLIWTVLYSGGPPDGDLIALCGTERLARWVQILCFLGFGLSGSVQTLLWRGEWGGFLGKSLVGLLVTGLGLGLWQVTLLGWPWHVETWLFWLGGSASLFLFVWLVRFMAWRTEVERIRAGLALNPPPSPLRWRETLPEMVLAAVLMAGLRPLLGLLDGRDVPVLRALVLPLLLWPFLAGAMGLYLGRRHGITPLLPLVMGLAFLPNLLYRAAPYGWGHVLVYAALALAGNLLGAALRKK